MNDSEWAVRARALEALIRIGDEQAQALWLRQLRDEEENVRECILESMSELPPTVLEPMLPGSSAQAPRSQSQNSKIDGRARWLDSFGAGRTGARRVPQGLGG